MVEIPTPHISANYGDFAKTVIMTGDPLRSKLIADTFLNDAKLVNNVRGIQGYTGTYKGKRVSVMASGMGNPSMGIYSWELFKFYGVENIIRVGTAGALIKEGSVGTLAIACNTFSNTNYFDHYILNGESKIEGSKKLSELAIKKANALGMTAFSGDFYCSDTFYNEEENAAKFMKMGIIAVEMESAALYINAKKLNKNALTICTYSDNYITKENSTALERQEKFKDMLHLALEMAIEL